MYIKCIELIIVLNISKLLNRPPAPPPRDSWLLSSLLFGEYGRGKATWGNQVKNFALNQFKGGGAKFCLSPPPRQISGYVPVVNCCLINDRIPQLILPSICKTSGNMKIIMIKQFSLACRQLIHPPCDKTVRKKICFFCAIPRKCARE